MGNGTIKMKLGTLMEPHVLPEMRCLRIAASTSLTDVRLQALMSPAVNQ